MEAAEANRCPQGSASVPGGCRMSGGGLRIAGIPFSVSDSNHGIAEWERFGARLFESLDVVPIPALPIGALFI